MFKLCFVLFVISLSFGSSIYISMFTPRQFFAMVMALFCLININKLIPYFNKLILAYCIFLIFEGLSFFLEHHFLDFLSDLISKHFVALVAYFSSVLMMKKCENVNLLAGSLLLCGIINGGVCLLQYLGYPLALQLGVFFCDLENESIITSLNNMLEGASGAYLFGLMGHPVYNGYYMTMITFLPIIYLNSRKKKLQKIALLILLITLMFVLFVIQQRSCFFIVFLLMVFYFLRKSKKKNILIFALFMLPILVVITLSIDWSTLLAGSRYIRHDIEEESRLHIYIGSVYFLLSNFLTGGYYSFIADVGNAPHNIIINAFVYGGVFGAIAILYVYFKQLKISYELFQNCDNEISAISLSFVAFSLNALLHNNSIVTGDAFVWLLWGFLMYSYSKCAVTNRITMLR